MTTPLWSIVANVRPEPVGRATSPGTRHFVAGAKIYCVDWMWGMGFDTVVAVGRHRGSQQLIELLMPTRHLTHFRAKHVHRPGVIRKLLHARWYRPRTREWCEEVAVNLGKFFPAVENLGERKALFARALDVMRDDPRGRALREQAIAALDRLQQAEDAMTIFVLCDYLEQNGASLSYDEVVALLRRQRDNP